MHMSFLILIKLSCLFISTHTHTHTHRQLLETRRMVHPSKSKRYEVKRLVLLVAMSCSSADNMSQHDAIKNKKSHVATRLARHFTTVYLPPTGDTTWENMVTVILSIFI